MLGLAHYSGSESPQEAMQNMAQAMRDNGVTRPQFYLVGGMMMPRENAGGSLDAERGLLALSGTYDIRSVRLHTSDGEQDPRTGEDNSVDVVMTPTNIYFRRTRMHEYDSPAPSHGSPSP